MHTHVHATVETYMQCYTRAVIHCTCLIPELTGRAAALIKLGDHSAAIDDCHAALRLQPAFAIAYNRLGCIILCENSLQRRA